MKLSIALTMLAVIISCCTALPIDVVGKKTIIRSIISSKPKLLEDPSTTTIADVKAYLKENVGSNYDLVIHGNETKKETDAPTSAPTDAPTSAPTDAPTSAPTDAPTAAPTDAPTAAPTDASTHAPTDAPTAAPTDAPTSAPTDATAAPTDAPTAAPTDAPTAAPTNAPGTWELGANIDPCDGGNFGYGGPWSQNEPVGSPGTAFTHDFLDTTVWNTDIGYITIVRHVNGECTMSKTWELFNQARSLQSYFSDYPGRIYATGDGTAETANTPAMFSDIPASADGLTGTWKDPIFGAEGGLVFNWWYSNNGARIALPGGYKTPYQLPGTSTNNDDVHGLGNELGKTGTSSGQGSSQWWHDVGKIGPDCHGTTCEVLGSDHGTRPGFGSDSPDCSWGGYAIFVSETTPTGPFSCQGQTLFQTMPMTQA